MSTQTTRTTTKTTRTAMAGVSLDEELENELAVHANAFASAHGLQVASKSNDAKNEKGLIYETAPISLLPNAFSKREFVKAQSLAPSLAVLVDRISQDEVFLQETLSSVVETDDFTKKLLDLYMKIYVSNDDESNYKNARKADRLGIFRSDYMLHPKKQSNSDQNNYIIQQVELNTIAASFAGLATRVAALHRHLTTRYANSLKQIMSHNQLIIAKANGTASTQTDEDSAQDFTASLPPSPAMTEIPKAISIAHQHYATRYLNNNNKNDDDASPQLAVLFVVQDGETNTVDQRILEFALWDQHQIPVTRLSLTRMATQLMLGSDGQLLSKDGKWEYSIAYFRAGYAPTDYPSDLEWKSREMIELSRATKCPCLGHHLAGTKKVQQALARPNVVERFLKDPEEATQVRQVFAGLYSLDSEDATPSDLEAVTNVLETPDGPDSFVLKPQREGGGYNFYGQDLLDKLKANVVKKQNDNGDSSLVLSKELSEFILMERLFPPIQPSILLRRGVMERNSETGVALNPTISELGCFGCLVVSPQKDEKDVEILHNEYAGYLLRTKFHNVDEGGVASGFATLSSVYLC